MNINKTHAIQCKKVFLAATMTQQSVSAIRWLHGGMTNYRVTVTDPSGSREIVNASFNGETRFKTLMEKDNRLAAGVYLLRKKHGRSFGEKLVCGAIFDPKTK